MTLIMSLVGMYNFGFTFILTTLFSHRGQVCRPMEEPSKRHSIVFREITIETCLHSLRI